MSRCFPFPPPGYEKKARTDDVDLLKKEKHKDKKHKKEKKEKEKKDSNENRKRDRSEGKDREKKDRKEKHRDKKNDKEKDRDKDKDKISTSDEKKLTGKSEGRNGEIHGQKEYGEKGKSSYSNEERVSGKFLVDNGEKLSQNSHLAEETKDSKFLQELGRRINSDGDRGAASQSAVENFMVTDRKKDQAVIRLVAKDIGNWAEGKEKNKDTKGEDRKMDGRGSRDEAESSGNTMLHNLPGFVQDKFKGIPRPLGKNIERTMEGKDKTEKKEGDDKRGDKRKDKDIEKKSQGKDKNRDKEKKKEKVKEKREQKSVEHDKFKEGGKNDHVGNHSNKMLDLSKDSDMSSAAVEGNLRKRKDLEANGFFHATDIRLNKLPLPPSSHSSPLVENGRVLEPCQTLLNASSEQQGVASNHIVDKKKQKVNGVIEGQPVSASSIKLAPATAEADKVAKASMKRQHPDSKYLDQILSVPKMEEWSDFDDQEWLLGRSETQLKKPKVGDSGVNDNETPQVWEAALHIDSADICALPYVIPY